MSELSNLLRQRLGVQPGAQINGAENNGAGVHPDADTLTAYSEQLLPTAERQQVVKHLSTCGECREILALSQAEVPDAAVQTVLKPAPVSLWRKLLSPAFGIAGVVAAMALIAVVVLQLPHKSGQPNQEAKVAPAQTSDQNTAAQPQPAAPVSAQPEAARSFSGQEAAPLRAKQPETVAGLAAMNKPSVLPNKTAAARQSASAPVQPVFTAELKKQDFVNRAFLESMNGNGFVGDQGGNDLPSAPQPARSEARFNVNTPGQIPNFYDIPANAASSKSSLVVLTPTPPPDHAGFAFGKIVKKGAHGVFSRTLGSAPAISSSTLTTNAMSLAPRLADTTKAEPGAMAAAPPVESAGLAGSGSFTARSRPSLSTAETTAANWKVADGKLLKSFGQSAWEEAHTPAAFQFTSVSAHGGEVWAGGANAGLIHSYDGGNTWNMVRLGEAASGAIVSILFAGNNVQIKTSDDQSWSSADGGKSWVKN
jgi:hypothetical protein